MIRWIFADNRQNQPSPVIGTPSNIGKGNKKNQEDKIGRFGVGFKTVFAYCETPYIWSPTFSFRITELVLPEEISPDLGIGDNTRFKFPFNNPKKAPPDAQKEIEAGLQELAETTLLFLANLCSISWQVHANPPGIVSRVDYSEHHIEVRKQVGEATVGCAHFLRFSAPVAGLERQRVSIAYRLDPLSETQSFDKSKSLKSQLKIVPASPGRGAVFFPAEKETSGLRFHLHAPFVPELSRASIKETPANTPLFNQLAELAASSLHRIKEMGLLTGEFLAVLPNPQDPLPPRYQPIRKAIIREMTDKPLTPTHARSHAPAKQLLQAKASLKDLLLVRLCDGRYNAGKTCFFPTDGIEHSAEFPLVDERTYSSGKSKQQQEDARKLLEKIGVREVGEAEQVEVILKSRYTQGPFPDDKIYLKDRKRFMALMEKNLVKGEIFRKYHIFKTAGGGWAKPGQVYLDAPVLETGLRAYYDAAQKRGAKVDMEALSDWYATTRISLNDLNVFAQRVGVEAGLCFVECDCNLKGCSMGSSR